MNHVRVVAVGAMCIGTAARRLALKLALDRSFGDAIVAQQGPAEAQYCCHYGANSCLNYPITPRRMRNNMATRRTYCKRNRHRFVISVPNPGSPIPRAVMGFGP
jgi:hypothetical protein